MTVEFCGFSERIFEFAFNAEFSKNVVLVSVPDIPTQNAEKRLGYDVKLEIERRGGGKRVVCLQHKIARFVSGSSGSNAKFRAKVGVPYFAFPLDVNQFNLIERLSARKRKRVEYYFCAPTFTSRNEINERYLASTILPGSVWFDVTGCGQLKKGSHAIVYSTAAKLAFVFSDAPRKVALLGIKEHLQSDLAPVLAETDYRKVLTDVNEVVREYWPHRVRGEQEEMDPEYRLPFHPPPALQAEKVANPLIVAGELLAKYYGMTTTVQVST